jgi:hypothetical protein
VDAAQVAREVARGNGLVTKVARPAEMRLIAGADAGARTGSLPAIGTPPLYALVLAPIFKVGQGFFEFNPGRDGVICPLDRVVAAVGVVCFLLGLLVLHGLALRLFDAPVAAVAFCQPLWSLAISGSPRM